MKGWNIVTTPRCGFMKSDQEVVVFWISAMDGWIGEEFDCMEDDQYRCLYLFSSGNVSPWLI